MNAEQTKTAEMLRNEPEFGDVIVSDEPEFDGAFAFECAGREEGGISIGYIETDGKVTWISEG